MKATSDQEIEFSIIVETYNFDEGGEKERLRKVLRAAVGMLFDGGRGELLVADSCGDSEIDKIIAVECPGAKKISAVALGYDDAKMLAAKAAAGRYILYLDGDCLPEPNWHLHLLNVLRAGKTIACGGYTRYDGGFYAALTSIMDFGFMYPVTERDLDCYASNNCGFAREALEKYPFPGAKMRCSCYYHAQCFLRNNLPMRLVPAARVKHEVQPLIRERTRQGYDTVAACWTDPMLYSARWLKLGLLSVPLFYFQAVSRDWQRLLSARHELKIDALQMLVMIVLFPLLRLIDIVGMVHAFMTGPREGGWGGLFVTSRYAKRRVDNKIRG